MPRTGLTRSRIVDAAFCAWGRHRFVHTGLDLVARELSVTKPAIYRYFRNKDELVAEMERDYGDQTMKYVVEPLRRFRHENAPLTPDDVVRTFCGHIFQLFEDKPYHYLFFLRRLVGRTLRTDPGASSARTDVTGGAELLSALTLLLRDAGVDARAARYLLVAAVFWMTNHYRADLGFDPATTRPFEPAHLAQSAPRKGLLITAATEHVVRGFAPGLSDQIDQEMVERIATIAPEELPEPDRIFLAIETVVEEHGYAGATVERIARALEMTKSSLYHYFRNKDEMLSRTVLREQEEFARIAALRFRQLATDDERLYALFVLFADYAALRPQAAIVENWVRESNIEVQIPAAHVVEVQKIYTFITDMLVAGSLAGSPGDAFGILQFIHFLVMQENPKRARGDSADRDNHTGHRRALRTLFRRFTDGVQTDTVGGAGTHRTETDSSAGMSQQGVKTL
ncbi:MAG: TetR/AcrR family transcriptional regulator [Spirochaeta sp.]|nr:TetR/AcrR family transcriptional regulator [Spirochaeta sp.]